MVSRSLLRAYQRKFYKEHKAAVAAQGERLTAERKEYIKKNVDILESKRKAVSDFKLSRRQLPHGRSTPFGKVKGRFVRAQTPRQQLAKGKAKALEQIEQYKKQVESIPMPQVSALSEREFRKITKKSTLKYLRAKRSMALKRAYNMKIDKALVGVETMKVSDWHKLQSRVGKEVYG